MKWTHIKKLKGHSKLILAITALILAPLACLYYGYQSEDTSYLEVAIISPELKAKSLQRESPKTMGLEGATLQELEAQEQRNKQRKAQKGSNPKPEPINYHAPQVIVRAGVYHLPMGYQLRGVLVSPLDTRRKRQLAQVRLPKAVTFKDEEVFPAQTVLWGEVSYQGKGKVLEVHFQRGLTPEGMEFALAGKAFLTGRYHSKAGERIAKSVGLAAISDMATVLTEKKVMGRGWGAAVERKPTLPNALLHATGEAARREAERQMENIVEVDYVTIEAQTQVTIQLTETFRGGNP